MRPIDRVSIRRDARRHAQTDIDRVQAAEDRLEKLLRAEEQKLTGGPATTAMASTMTVTTDSGCEELVGGE